jgi:hypothetical protein
MMTDEERNMAIAEAQIAVAQTLGELLGFIDSMITLHDAGLYMDNSTEKLRAKRAAYDAADKAYRGARLAL